MVKKAIVVAGVAGSGKTTIAQALAEQIGWAYIEADDYHSEASKRKMASGQPLNDDDRAPWLEILNQQMQRQAPAVLACSALKQRYRDRLGRGLTLKVIWIDIDPKLAEERLSTRTGHFMPASLVDSQFAAVELPQHAIILNTSEPVDKLLQDCLSALRNFVNID